MTTVLSLSQTATAPPDEKYNVACGKNAVSATTTVTSITAQDKAAVSLISLLLRNKKAKATTTKTAEIIMPKYFENAVVPPNEARFSTIFSVIPATKSVSFEKDKIIKLIFVRPTIYVRRASGISTLDSGTTKMLETTLPTLT